MPDDFRFADELGPAKIIHVYEPTTGLKGTLVIDNVARGPSIGGTRMAEDVSTAECFRLARAMTLKNAAAGLAHGGGKSVIAADPRMPAAEKERVIRAFAHALRNETDYIFGPDMGTDETCMAWVHDEIGRAVGLPKSIGGIPLDELGATGWGLAHAADIAAPYAGIKLDGARVAIQGFGAVGIHAARFLALRGAVLVAASDSQATIADPSGLDVDALARWKSTRQSLAEFPRKSSTEILSRDAIIDCACEIWIPAARPDVVNGANIDRLKTKLVLQGANIPFTDEAERSAHARGVLIVPDFIANAGGVICAAMEYHGATQKAAFDAIGERIRENTEAVLRDARDRGALPRVAATELAVRRVRDAMRIRRHTVM